MLTGLKLYVVCLFITSGYSLNRVGHWSREDFFLFSICFVPCTDNTTL